MQFGFILGLIFTIIVSIFAVQNSGQVLIDFFFAKYYVSQAIVIIVCMAVGALVSALLGSFGQIKNRKTIKQLKTSTKGFESESADLSNKLATYENKLKDIEAENDSLKEELRIIKGLFNGKDADLNSSNDLAGNGEVLQANIQEVQDVVEENIQEVQASDENSEIVAENKEIVDLDSEDEKCKAES